MQSHVLWGAFTRLVTRNGIDFNNMCHSRMHKIHPLDAAGKHGYKQSKFLFKMKTTTEDYISLHFIHVITFSVKKLSIL